MNELMLLRIEYKGKEFACNFKPEELDDIILRFKKVLYTNSDNWKRELERKAINDSYLCPLCKSETQQCRMNIQNRECSNCVDSKWYWYSFTPKK